VLGWATGNLAEPRNNPQIGMANVRGLMPALTKSQVRNPRPQRPALSLSQPARQQRTTPGSERT